MKKLKEWRDNLLAKFKKESSKMRLNERKKEVRCSLQCRDLHQLEVRMTHPLKR
jgi:hypothetical protein